MKVASVIGASHLRAGTATQDAVGSGSVGTCRWVCVADGHGGARYTHSAMGAALAVELFGAIVGAAVEKGLDVKQALSRLCGATALRSWEIPWAVSPWRPSGLPWGVSSSHLRERCSGVSATPTSSWVKPRGLGSSPARGTVSARTPSPSSAARPRMSVSWSVPLPRWWRRG